MEQIPRYDAPIPLGDQETKPVKSILVGMVFMGIYGFVFAPLIKRYLPQSYLLCTSAVAMGAVVLSSMGKGRRFYVYPDRLVEKRPLRKDMVYHFYTVTQIKKRALGRFSIRFGHRHLKLPRNAQNVGAVLSAMERYFLHKENVVPISLIRILKELRMCA